MKGHGGSKGNVSSMPGGRKAPKGGGSKIGKGHGMRRKASMRKTKKSMFTE